MKNQKIKDILKYIYPIIALLIINIALFTPQLDGKKLPQDDIVKGIAKTKHINEFREKGDDYIYWNSAQFAGGPILLMNLGGSNNYLRHIDRIFALGYHGPIIRFFKLGVVMYLSLILLGVSPWLAFAFSLVYLLNTNLFILFKAGHNSKVTTITYFPLIISGLILFFRSQNLKGAMALIIGTSLALYYKHIQMTYYLLIVLFIFVLVLSIFYFIKGEQKKLLKGLALAIVAAAIAGLSNFAQLDSSYNFSKKTMRGENVLKKENKTSKIGLDWDYAMSWSYELKDVFGMIVPRMVGGSSTEKIDKKDPLAKLLIQNGAKSDKDGLVSVPGYWSSMLFSAGPPYIGASLIFLVVFSLISLKRPIAISLSISLVVLLAISLGSHAEWLNRFLFENLPLFNKFRAPSSAIALVPIVLTIIAGLGINTILKEKTNKEKYLKPLLISLAITGSICLIIALFGKSFFSFLSENDLKYPQNIQDIFVNTRSGLQKADAFRSLLFILLSFGIVYMFLKDKLKSSKFFILALIGIFIFDILPINKRYLTNNDFVSTKKYDKLFTKKKSDIEIEKMEPNGRGFYRVFDLSVNTFNDSSPSYHHNQIGGYDPAKLQRYNDLITHHISKSNMQVLNMLNAKYFVTKEQIVQVNSNANGNAWFVSKVLQVENSQDEINSLSSFDSKNEAIVNSAEFETSSATYNPNGSINLTSYKPDHLIYNSSSTENQLAVFSEVWYGGNPDWIASIDGEVVEIKRVNYLLRALEIPSGNHEIVFSFKPKAKGYLISSLFSVLGILIILFGLYKLFYQTNETIEELD